MLMLWLAGIAGTTFISLLLLAGVLHLVPCLGAVGRRISDAFCHAPLVDVILFLFTAAPNVVGAVLWGWRGAFAALAGQLLALWVWIILHELTHPRARKGPRIYRTLDRIVGTVRNHLAVWITTLAVPLFWGIRLAEVVVYPCLVVLVYLPPLRQRTYVTLSRHKFTGLVGYDLIWCLYCDWMTGVWSLGSEMLRSVESFWCPIRFYDGKKCENCKLDFPDIDGGWIPADGTMAQVTAVLEKEHGQSDNAWFSRPVKLTVRESEPAGNPPATSPPSPQPHSPPPGPPAA